LLGLHRVPDTVAALPCFSDTENQHAARTIWRLSNIFRVLIWWLPPMRRLIISQIITIVIYWPSARLAALVSAQDFFRPPFHLNPCRNRKCYVIRTDAYQT
jgi:hypothetical protein